MKHTHDALATAVIGGTRAATRAPATHKTEIAGERAPQATGEREVPLVADQTRARGGDAAPGVRTTAPRPSESLVPRGAAKN